MFENIFEKLENRTARSPFPQTAYIDIWQSFFRKCIDENIAKIPAEIFQATSAACFLPQKLLRKSLRTSLAGLSRSFFIRERKISPQKSSPRTAIVSAGNMPLVALAPSILLASAGVPVIVKLTEADSALFPWMIQQVERESPGFQSGVFARHWSSKDARLSELFSLADKILVFGENQTTQLFEQNFPAKIIGFGHKFSVGYADDAIFDASRCAGFARDAVLYFQRGCLSCQVIFVKSSSQACTKWMEAFSKSYSEITASLIGFENANKRNRGLTQIREILDLQGAVYREIHPRFGLTVFSEKFSTKFLLGEGVVQIVPVADEADMPRQLAPCRKSLQGLAVSSFNRFDAVRERALSEGFSYVCEAGGLQAPPLNWANGNIALPDAVVKNA